MGQQLTAYFDKAKSMGGLKAQMRLAMISKMSSSIASSAPDSPDNIKAMEQAMAEIKKEFI